MLYKLETKGKDILKTSNNLSWGTSSDTLGSQLSFDSLEDLSMGQIVKFFIDGYEVFRGVVVLCTENKFYYNYTCFDYSFYLKNEVVKQFNNVDVTSALSSLLLEHELGHIIVNIPTKINKFYNGVSLADIIDDMIDIAQKDQGKYYYREMDGGRLVIEELEGKAIYPKLVFGDFTTDWSIENRKNRIIVSSGNEEEGKIEAEAFDEQSKWWHGLLQKVEKVDADNVAQAQNMANNLLSQLNKTTRTATIPCLVLDRAETLKANRYIKIEMPKRWLNGWYKIKSVKHTLVNGVHKADIELEW